MNSFSKKKKSRTKGAETGRKSWLICQKNTVVLEVEAKRVYYVKDNT